MNVEAICPLCYASHIVSATLRGKKYRCDQCEEIFLVNPEAKTTTKKPRPLPSVKPSGEDEAGKDVAEAQIVEPKSATPDEPELQPEAIQSDARTHKARPIAQPRRDEEEDAPRQRRRRREEQDEEDEEEAERKPKVRRARRSAGMPVALIVCGVAGAVILVAGMAAAAWWLFSSSGTPAPPGPMAQTPLPNNGPPNNVNPNPMPNPPPPAVNPPRPEPARPRPRPPRERPKPPEPPRRELPPAEQIGWQVKLDPTLAAPAPADRKRDVIRFRHPGTDVVVYPALPSSFAMLGQNIVARDERQVWNLETMEMTGRLAGRIDCGPPVALSPAGRHFACVVPTRTSTVDVWSLADGKATRLQVHETPVFVDLLEFCAPDKLLTCTNGTAGKKRFRIWNVTTGQSEKEWDGPGLFERDSPAFSPAGQYLAFATLDELYVYDLRTGTAAGCRALPKPEPFATMFCRGLAFSRDGKELAGVFEVGAESRIIVWDVARGEVAGQHAFPGDFKVTLKNAIFYSGAKIDWLHDGSGWLVHGQLIVDRTTGATLATIPMADPMPGRRRILDREHLAVVTDAMGRRTLSVEKLPWEQINEARKARAGGGR